MSPEGIEDLVACAAGLTELPAWQTLVTDAKELGGTSLSTVLDEPGRFARFSAQTDELVLDYSRSHLSLDAKNHLIELALARGLPAWRQALFSGATVNNTEDRAALHVALRGRGAAQFKVDGEDVTRAIKLVRERMFELASALRAGEYRGHTGAPIRQLVNIGIGGSDLGLVMVTEALRDLQSEAIDLHFVSNIDGLELADLVNALDPAETLFVICSKSFSTLETRLNAEAAREWLVSQLGEEAVAKHFVAISVNSQAMDQFGIDPELRFEIWDWVGGRYSLWSAIGLSIAIAIGPAAFAELLDGAADMDEHFCTAELAENLPVLLALVGIWNANLLSLDSHAILPYSYRLRRLPAFLQQLEMESNGKSVTRSGEAVTWRTGPVIWGEAGSNAQHSFFQLLHQGTARVSMDFIGVARGGYSPDHNQQTVANMLAQAEAFARGYPAESVRVELETTQLSSSAQAALLPHKLHPGGRPCNILLMKSLTAKALGQLIALYEHKVFVQSVIWGINPFDQWGVELGKRMADKYHQAIEERARERLPGLAKLILDWNE